MAVTHHHQKGFIFLEILIATALISIVFVALMGVGVQALNISSSIKKTTQIDALIKEEMEAVRSFRDGTVWATTGLGGLATGSNSPYYMVLNTGVNPNTWITQTGTETVSGFSRKVHFDKVSRDPATSDIEGTYNASNDDPDTRKATVTIASGSNTYEVITYFTNWQP